MNETSPARKYYLHDGEQQTGPFSLDELAQTPLTSTAMIWYKGLNDWQEAATIAELQPIINHTLPPVSIEEEVAPPPFKGAKERSKTAEVATPPHSPHPFRSGFFKFIVVVALLIISGTAIRTVQQYRMDRITMNADSTATEPTYEEQILSIEDQEKAAPKKFLKAAGDFKKTVFGGNFKIDGTITNSATVAKFKNALIEVSFYTDKNKYISASRFTIEDSFPAGSTKEFKLKIDPPKGADNCKWKVAGAVAYWIGV